MVATLRRLAHLAVNNDRFIGLSCSVFFFQAEDGIRDVAVTGVQTCALPISSAERPPLDFHYQLLAGARSNQIGGRSALARLLDYFPAFLAKEIGYDQPELGFEIGRASCRERV